MSSGSQRIVEASDAAPATSLHDETVRRRRFSVGVGLLVAASFAVAVADVVRGPSQLALVTVGSGVWASLLWFAVSRGVSRLWGTALLIAAAPLVASARFTLRGQVDPLSLAWLLAPVVGLVLSPSLPTTLGELAGQLMPVRGADGSLERLRSQMMVITLLISSFAALTTAPGYWFLGLHLSAVLTALFGVLLVGLTVLYRRGWSVRATWLSLLVLTATFLGVSVSCEHPLEYSALLWSLVFPVSGFLLVGEREGTLGAVVAVALVLGVPVLHGRLDVHLQADVGPMVLVVRTLSLIIGLALFTGASERLRLVAYAEAERARKARSLFLANVSHELRTPMHGMLGLTELLLSQQPRSDQREHLELIDRSGQLLLAIITDILSLTSLESGAMPLTRSQVNVGAVVSDVVSLLSPVAAGKGLRLDVEGSAPSTVMLDATRLRQVLLNLVGNAVKFTETGGVTLRLSPEQAGIFTIEVEDTGIGVPEAFRERMFQPFQQADESSTRRFGGTGLGLALSRQLARALGGELSHRARAAGGSVFVLVLPVR